MARARGLHRYFMGLNAVALRASGSIPHEREIWGDGNLPSKYSTFEYILLASYRGLARHAFIGLGKTLGQSISLGPLLSSANLSNSSLSIPPVLRRFRMKYSIRRVLAQCRKASCIRRSTLPNRASFILHEIKKPAFCGDESLHGAKVS